ncbi:MAG: hypothetical protein OXT07_09835 [bacterium]|nr:hypothetical protein [bacterium]
MALAALAALAVLAAPAAAQGAASPVADRDRLIADQENLLNAYRCLYETDTYAVAGGCDGTSPARLAEPGLPPESPTQADIDIRDDLVAAQERLLNVYRCQFKVDTQLVHGGCPQSPVVAAVLDAVAAIQNYDAFDGHREGIAHVLTRDLWGAVTGLEELAPVSPECTLSADWALGEVNDFGFRSLSSGCLTTSVDAEIAAAIADLDAAYRNFNQTYGTECGRHALRHDNDEFDACILRRSTSSGEPLPNINFYGRWPRLDGPGSLEDVLVNSIINSANPEIASVFSRADECGTSMVLGSGQNRNNWFYSTLAISRWAIDSRTAVRLEGAVHDSLDAVRSLGVDTLDNAWASTYNNPQEALRALRERRLWGGIAGENLLDAAIGILEANGVDVPPIDDPPAVSCPAT